MGHVNFPVLAINTHFPSLQESVLLLAIKILTYVQWNVISDRLILHTSLCLKKLHNQTGRWLIDVCLAKMLCSQKSVTSEARCLGEIGSFLIFGFPSLSLHASTRFITKVLL